MDSKEKIFHYFMETSKGLEEKILKKEIKLDDYQFVNGVLLGLLKAYVWTYGEDDNYMTMVGEVE